MEFRIEGLEFRVEGLEFGIEGLGAWSLKLRVLLSTHSRSWCSTLNPEQNNNGELTDRGLRAAPIWELLSDADLERCVCVCLCACVREGGGGGERAEERKRDRERARARATDAFELRRFRSCCLMPTWNGIRLIPGLPDNLQACFCSKSGALGLFSFQNQRF